MTTKAERTAAAFGARLAGMPQEKQIETLVTHITGAPAHFSWKDSDRRAGPPKLIGMVESAGKQWALAAEPGDAAKRSILIMLTSNRVHEAAGCTCKGPWPCPAYRAFERAAAPAEA